jgi:hypothetical protein
MGIGSEWHFEVGRYPVKGASTGNGRVWIHQKGVSKPVLSIPLQNPDAVLIPQFFAAFRR